MFNHYVKFLTSDPSIRIKNTDFKTSKYETKKKGEESVYDVGKKTYCERRGGTWRTSRTGQFRQLESLVRDKSILICEWTNESLVTIVFSSGAIAYLSVKPESVDITQILFDKYFVGKLSGQAVTSVVISTSHIILMHTDRFATIVTFGKVISSKKPSRIIDRDPNLWNIELGGPRRAERRMTWCGDNSSIRIMVWSVTAAEPAPWSPAIEDHANLHLYEINGQRIQLIAYHQLENDTLLAELSHRHYNIVHIVEQVPCQKNGVNLEWLRYEIPTSEEKKPKMCILRESATCVSLPSPARVVKRSPCDLRLLVACIDGSLHVIHHEAGLTHSTKTEFIATDIQWVDELIVAAEEGGRFQFFDRALSLLHQHSKCIDLSTYLREPHRMSILAAKEQRHGSLFLTSFLGGPVALLRITHPQILTAWIRHGRLSNAVSLLQAMDWESEGRSCLWALTRILQQWTCRQLDPRAADESERLVRIALSALVAPHARAYIAPLRRLARTYFHHLLRRGHMEKALSLAVELSAWDLCADTRWAAEPHEPVLAREAAHLALYYADTFSDRDCDCSGSCSDCDSQSYSSESDNETSASSEVVQNKAPPLPLVPAILPVAVTTNEPTSTNSIRPNLHQYLERDTTIWNTNVKDDAHIKVNELKPVLTIPNLKWPRVDDVLRKQANKIGGTIDGIATDYRNFNPIERSQEFQSNSHQYKINNNFYTTAKDSERLRINGEKNKVKFSDTVTVSVMSKPSVAVETARELADSLPLTPPHAYLAAFTPQSAPRVPHVLQPPLVSRPSPVSHSPHAPQPTHLPPPADNGGQKPFKIKVVHFGMV